MEQEEEKHTMVSGDLTEEYLLEYTRYLTEQPYKDVQHFIEYKMGFPYSIQLIHMVKPEISRFYHEFFKLNYDQIMLEQKEKEDQKDKIHKFIKDKVIYQIDDYLELHKQNEQVINNIKNLMIISYNVIVNRTPDRYKNFYGFQKLIQDQMKTKYNDTYFYNCDVQPDAWNRDDFVNDLIQSFNSVIPIKYGQNNQSILTSKHRQKIAFLMWISLKFEPTLISHLDNLIMTTSQQNIQKIQDLFMEKIDIFRDNYDDFMIVTQILKENQACYLKDLVKPFQVLRNNINEKCIHDIDRVIQYINQLNLGDNRVLELNTYFICMDLTSIYDYYMFQYLINIIYQGLQTYVYYFMHPVWYDNQQNMQYIILKGIQKFDLKQKMKLQWIQYQKLAILMYMLVNDNRQLQGLQFRQNDIDHLFMSYFIIRFNSKCLIASKCMNLPCDSFDFKIRIQEDTGLCYTLSDFLTESFETKLYLNSYTIERNFDIYFKTIKDEDDQNRQDLYYAFQYYIDDYLRINKQFQSTKSFHKKLYQSDKIWTNDKKQIVNVFQYAKLPQQILDQIPIHFHGHVAVILFTLIQLSSLKQMNIFIQQLYNQFDNDFIQNAFDSLFLIMITHQSNIGPYQMQKEVDLPLQYLVQKEDKIIDEWIKMNHQSDEKLYSALYRGIFKDINPEEEEQEQEEEEKQDIRVSPLKIQQQSNFQDKLNPIQLNTDKKQEIQKEEVNESWSEYVWQKVKYVVIFLVSISGLIGINALLRQFSSVQQWEDSLFTSQPQTHVQTPVQTPVKTPVKSPVKSVKSVTLTDNNGHNFNLVMPSKPIKGLKEFVKEMQKMQSQYNGTPNDQKQMQTVLNEYQSGNKQQAYIDLSKAVNPPGTTNIILNDHQIAYMNQLKVTGNELNFDKQWIIDHPYLNKAEFSNLHSLYQQSIPTPVPTSLLDNPVFDVFVGLGGMGIIYLIYTQFYKEKDVNEDKDISLVKEKKDDVSFIKRVLQFVKEYIYIVSGIVLTVILILFLS